MILSHNLDIIHCIRSGMYFIFIFIEDILLDFKQKQTFMKCFACRLLVHFIKQ